MYFINSLWEGVLLKQLAAVFKSISIEGDYKIDEINISHLKCIDINDNGPWDAIEYINLYRPLIIMKSNVKYFLATISKGMLSRLAN